MHTISLSPRGFVCALTVLLSTQLRAAEPDAADAAALKTVLAAIRPALDKLQPEAKVEYPKERPRTIEILYLPQTFKVHGRNMTGEIAPEAHDRVGPSYKGFVLRASVQRKGEVNQAVVPQTLTEPYWRADLDITPLGKSDQQIFWSLAYGSQTDKKTLAAIREKLQALKDAGN